MADGFSRSSRFRSPAWAAGSSAVSSGASSSTSASDSISVSWVRAEEDSSTTTWFPLEVTVPAIAPPTCVCNSVPQAGHRSNAWGDGWLHCGQMKRAARNCDSLAKSLLTATSFRLERSEGEIKFCARSALIRLTNPRADRLYFSLNSRSSSEDRKSARNSLIGTFARRCSVLSTILGTCNKAPQRRTVVERPKHNTVRTGSGEDESQLSH